MRKKKKFLALIQTFRIPLIVALGIVTALIVQYVLGLDVVSIAILLFVILVGSFKLLKATAESIAQKKFVLDYIALLAITVGLLTQQYVVAAIIVLMLSGGNTLEEYGTQQAQRSLTALVDRIPNTVFLWEHGQIGRNIHIQDVTVGQEIAVRKGEVIPLDGVLVSDSGLTDESSLTGEPYTIEKYEGDQLRSGTVNIGDIIVIRVIRPDNESTYRKIIRMVQEAQNEKAPLIRLADKYSTIFTIITFILATVAYVISQDFERVLAVLVIATPCPLILATPIALMGGMNAAAKRRIIMKKLASLEVLSRVTTIIFDKTGTITLGKPVITNTFIKDKKYSEHDIYSIAAGIERNSLHPLAKAIVDKARQLHVRIHRAHEISEHIGSGISGVIEGKRYHLSKVHADHGMAIQLLHGNKQLAIFEFQDQLKGDSRSIIKKLKQLGLSIHMYTGDKQEAAEELVSHLGVPIQVKAECSPEDKKNGIAALKRHHQVVAMVGDGINDAPALAYADVGLVFSNEEHTAASEAADVVFLGGDFAAVTNSLSISQRTIHIALQSIIIGIGLSLVGMVFAALGFIPPVIGAFLQEAIDVSVIVNALRASRS